MSRMPMMRELQPLMPAAGDRVGGADTGWNRLSALFEDADLRAVLIFALIGLLASLCLTFLLPYSAETAAFFAQIS